MYVKIHIKFNLKNIQRWSKVINVINNVTVFNSFPSSLTASAVVHNCKLIESSLMNMPHY